MALNMVLTTIIGQCVGANRYDRAKDYLKCALGYGCGLLVILSVVVVGFSRQLSGLFVRSEDVAAIVGTYFLICSALGIFLTPSQIAILGSLNRDGETVKEYVSDDFLLHCSPDALGVLTFLSGVRPKWNLGCGIDQSCGSQCRRKYFWNYLFQEKADCRIGNLLYRSSNYREVIRLGSWLTCSLM